MTYQTAQKSMGAVLFSSAAVTRNTSRWTYVAQISKGALNICNALELQFIIQFWSANFKGRSNASHCWWDVAHMKFFENKRGCALAKSLRKKELPQHHFFYIMTPRQSGHQTEVADSSHLHSWVSYFGV